MKWFYFGRIDWQFYQQMFQETAWCWITTGQFLKQKSTMHKKMHLYINGSIKRVHKHDLNRGKNWEIFQSVINASNVFTCNIFNAFITMWLISRLSHPLIQHLRACLGIYVLLYKIWIFWENNLDNQVLYLIHNHRVLS